MSGCRREVERRILRLLHGRKTRTHLTQIHAHFLRHHLHHSNQILSHFVSVCGASDKMSYANLVFRQTHNPNIFLFNAMIKGYSLCQASDESLRLFTVMRNRNIWPDEFTFAPLLKSSVNLRELNFGEAIHGEVIVLGFDWFNSIRIGVVELYATCGKMKDAKKVFDEMPHRDVILWNLMIRGYCKNGDIEMGLFLFRQMNDRTVVSWNSMISSLSQTGRNSEALKLFAEMRDAGFEPDEATLVTILPVCSRLGEINVGKSIHSYAESTGLNRDSISVSNSLIDFYSKCGDLDNASSVFNTMPKKNVISWNAMISGLAFNGEGELGIKLFEEMIENGINPNDSTFVGVLTCCVHSGLVQKGRNLLNLMIEPKLEHYGCMVDVLGRNGCLKEAYDMIKTMPVEPNSALWGALLSACRSHGNTEMAECVVKELIEVEPWNSGNYVLLSNIYAERGKWNEVEKVRVLMREKRVKKLPGISIT